VARLRRIGLELPPQLRDMRVDGAGQHRSGTASRSRFVEADLKEAGFEIAARETTSTTRPAHRHQGSDAPEAPIEWLLVARRPIAR
jgi:hypothetical protein